jgi:hypothetical protein
MAGVFPAWTQNAVEPVQANPNRPTVTSTATLAPVGYLQFENGGLYAAGTPGMAAQLSLSQVTRLAVHPRLEFFSQWQPWARSSPGGDNEPGGVMLGARTVALTGQGLHPTLSFGYLRTLYAGRTPSLDVGSAFQSAFAMLNIGFPKTHIYSNFIANEQKGDGVRRVQWGQTLCLSRDFGRASIYGELWHFTQPLARGNAVGNLWAVAYTARPNLVFDGGFNRGLTSSSTSWEAFTGFTYLLPQRLWQR